jgi:hypothetical protein
MEFSDKEVFDGFFILRSLRKFGAEISRVELKEQTAT